MAMPIKTISAERTMRDRIDLIVCLSMLNLSDPAPNAARDGGSAHSAHKRNSLPFCSCQWEVKSDARIQAKVRRRSDLPRSEAPVGQFPLGRDGMFTDLVTTCLGRRVSWQPFQRREEWKDEVGSGRATDPL